MVVVDTHHHVIPPAFAEIWAQNPGIARGLKLPPWDISKSLEVMQANGITHTIISLGHQIPHLIADSSAAAKSCRELNTWMAQLRDERGGQFGFLATLPSPAETEACVSELTHALDELHADGVVLATSYNGAYLGHPSFAPVWRALNDRSAVVLTHPGLDRMGDLIREPNPIPPPLLDWTHETTRCAVHLISTNTKRDVAPKCKIALSHAGGTIPFVINRVAHMMAGLKMTDKSADQFIDEARDFYFDVALSAFDGPVQLLVDFANKGHVLYGSDFPFAQRDVIALQSKSLPQLGLSQDVLQSIRRDAALALYPSLDASKGLSTET